MGGLPPLLQLKGGDSGAAGWVRSTVKHIISELDRGGTGAIEVANRLDVVFLHAVRAFLDESAESGESGWLAAIRDQQISRALAAIHRDPIHPGVNIVTRRGCCCGRTAKKTGAPDNGARDNLNQPSNRKSNAERAFALN